jgi:hypothetical protein
MLSSQILFLSVLFTFTGILFAPVVSCLRGISSDWSVGQVVKTTSGYVKGHAASISPTVSEYLGIRYAQPATGELRLAAPVAYKSSASFSADAYVRNLDFESEMIDADLVGL